MIFDALIEWFFDLVGSGVDTLPDAQRLPFNFSLEWISDINYFLPISEMFGFFLSMFLLGGPFIATSLVIWIVVGLIRGGPTKA